MSKEIKKKKKNKGFTLIEILVAVLILAILVAIAVPSYMRAVERSRTSDPINTLKSIAKAEQVQRLRAGEYTNQTQELDLQLTDYPAGNTVAGDTFEGQYYTYKVYGEDEAAALAKRKTTDPEEEYELSIDYGTGEIFCRPSTHKICMDLGLEEGRDFDPPKWVTCAGQIDNLWRTNFGVNDYKENKVSSCSVRVDRKANKTEFDFCFNRSNINYTVYGLGTNSYQGNSTWNNSCMRGYFDKDNKLAICIYKSPSDRRCQSFPQVIEKTGTYNYNTYACLNYNQTNQTCSYVQFTTVANGRETYRRYCNGFDSEGNCTNCYADVNSNRIQVNTSECDMVSDPFYGLN